MSTDQSRRNFLAGASAAALASTTLSVPGFAREGAEDAAKFQTVRAVAQKAVADGTVQSLSIAVLRDGRIEWEEAFGMADREAGIPATVHTSYSLASISKPITATALMTLVEAGKVDLAAPLDTYLQAGQIPPRIGDASDATVGLVANHTSGLPFHVQFFYEGAPHQRPPQSETIAKWAQIISRPGEAFTYSNLGFGLLGDVIEGASGQSLGDYLQSAVFAPLDMRATSLGRPTGPGVQAAVRYSAQNERLPYYVTDHAGASEFYSSAHDLIRFAAFHMNGPLPEQQPILTRRNAVRMHVNTARPGEESGYGIGFSTGRSRGFETVQHGGSMPGVATQMVMVPSKGVAYVVLCNTWVFEPRNEIVELLLDELLGAEPESSTEPAAEDGAENPVPADLAGEWVGTITRPEGDAVPVSLAIDEAGAIAARIGDRQQVAVTDAAYENRRLTGAIEQRFQAADTARYDNSVQLDLKHEGDRLYGGFAALDDLQNQTFAAGLTFWMDMQRRT
ncbi:serine hydrolase domain-containing protein [Pacificimonas sp. ICDLI1SI03]